MSDVKEKQVQAIGALDNGIFGTVTMPSDSFKKIEDVKAKPVKDLVAIHSVKNLYWSGVGKVLKGYNIVERHNAEKWLTKPGMRTATPEEVAKEYGL